MNARTAARARAVAFASGAVGVAVALWLHDWLGAEPALRVLGIGTLVFGLILLVASPSLYVRRAGEPDRLGYAGLAVTVTGLVLLQVPRLLFPRADRYLLPVAFLGLAVGAVGASIQWRARRRAKRRPSV